MKTALLIAAVSLFILATLFLSSCAAVEKKTGMSGADLLLLTVGAVQRYEAATQTTAAQIKDARLRYGQRRAVTAAKNPVLVLP